MKINKIFIGGLAMLTLTACNDYLDVDPATNAATVDFVYSTEAETSTALNGVYAAILTDETFGNKLYNNFMLNSDVDFYANANETAQGNQPRRFDVRSDASDVEKLWNNLYAGVETANEFIYNLKNSAIYEEGTEIESVVGDNGMENIEVPAVTSLTQMMGEAKVIRAMCYHELLSYWGDIPFTLEATFETDNLVPPITSRQAVSDALIKDLQEAAEYMKSDQDATLSAPERISKEAAYAMIARLALQAGGYSLNHAEGNTTQYAMSRPTDYKKYYEIAREYTKRIIDAGGHALNKEYRDVFVDECNFIVTAGDDPIFEIPFAKESTSCWGYYQGPASGIDTSVETDYSNASWGTANGGVRVSYFYRLQFEEGDLRRDYVCGKWYYGNQGQPTMRYDYGMHNNKWSKLWNTGGFAKTSTSATGINFAYIRYADVLLMFAEADNEVNNGPTTDAIAAVEQVRNRAFGGVNYQLSAAATSSKENFLKAVLDERKFEFAGENMRWKDLVRNNMYKETLFYTFLTYYAVGQDMGGSTDYFDMIEEHDGIEYSQKYSSDIFWTYVKNYNDPNFPNKSLYVPYIVNPYGQGSQPNQAPAAYFAAQGLDITPVSLKDITGLESSATTIGWNTASINWWNDNQGTPTGQVLYSLYGFIRGSQNGTLYVINNGAVTNLTVDTSNPEATVRNLPDVRYLLPIPEEAIARSGGAYKNYYAY